tara:strand:+ start:377 stop:538 length:162 start_codon:yes stop_codon:yes gene_type:complete
MSETPPQCGQFLQAISSNVKDLITFLKFHIIIPVKNNFINILRVKIKPCGIIV